MLEEIPEEMLKKPLKGEESQVILDKKTRIDELRKQLRHYLVKEPYVRESKKIGRNEMCPCGSNLKYKHCCGK